MRRRHVCRSSSNTGQSSETRLLAALRLRSASFLTTVRVARVRRYSSLLPGVWLILYVAELRLHPVDGRRNQEPTVTIIVHLTASDSKAVAELALQNLVRDTPQVTLAVSCTGDILNKLATEGKNVIQSDLANALKDAVPVIDNFVMVMDNIANVRTFCLRRLNIAHPWLSGKSISESRLVCDFRSVQGAIAHAHLISHLI